MHKVDIDIIKLPLTNKHLWECNTDTNKYIAVKEKSYECICYIIRTLFGSHEKTTHHYYSVLHGYDDEWVDMRNEGIEIVWEGNLFHDE